jgi:hypothetical protein
MSLIFGDLKTNKNNKDLEAISIVKGNKNSNYNKIVYISEDSNKGKSKLDIPLTNFF